MADVIEDVNEEINENEIQEANPNEEFNENEINNRRREFMNLYDYFCLLFF